MNGPPGSTLCKSGEQILRSVQQRLGAFYEVFPFGDDSNAAAAVIAKNDDDASLPHSYVANLNARAKLSSSQVLNIKLKV